MRVSSRSGGPQPIGKKRGRRDRLGLALGALVAAAAILVAVVTGAGGGSPSRAVVPRARLTGQLEGSAPWPRNVAGLGARLRELGLPALAQEGTALHIHQHLDLYVDGQA
jgi:hypothetical protein